MRWVWLGLVSLMFSTQSIAESFSPIDVVKIINFECTHCAQSNGLDNAFRKELKKYKARLVIAPVSTDTANNAKDRVFYAIKKVNEDASFWAKDYIFKAYHEFSMKLDDTYQVEEWLKQEMQNSPYANLAWDDIAKLYFTKDTDKTMIRAYNLVIQNDLENLPAFLFIKEGKVIKVIDYSEDKGIKGLKKIYILSMIKQENNTIFLK